MKVTEGGRVLVAKHARIVAFINWSCHRCRKGKGTKKEASEWKAEISPVGSTYISLIVRSNCWHGKKFGPRNPHKLIKGQS